MGTAYDEFKSSRKSRGLTIWEKIQSNVWLDPGTGCWIWGGAPGPGGYPILYWGNQKWRAHRASCDIAHGPMSEDQVTRHSCPEKMCVNPDHLSPGTQKENIADSIGAGIHAFGERCGNSKLREHQVLDIRQEHANGRSINSIAIEFDVAWNTIASIVKGVTWRHLKSPILQKSLDSTTA